MRDHEVSSPLIFPVLETQPSIQSSQAMSPSRVPENLTC